MRIIHSPLLIALAMTPIQQSSALGLPEIGASAAVSGVIGDLKSAVNDIINSLDDAVSNNSFRTRQHLEVLLGQLDILAQGTIDKSFSELNATERQVFQDIRASIDSVAELERVTANDVKQVTLTASTAIGNLPFAKGTPRVTNFAPGYVLHNQTARPGSKINVSVDGFLLGYKKPQFSIGRQACSLATKTETRLLFQCDRNLFKATNGATAITGKLTVFEKPGFWKSLRSWFRAKPLPREYSLSVFAVPPKLGDYKLSAIVSQEEVQTKKRNQSFQHKNGHCEGRREITFPFNANQGWLIDADSIAPRCSSSKKSRCLGLRNVTQRSFGFHTKTANNGQCVKVLGNIVARDARGAVWGNVTWQEYKSSNVDADQDIGSGELEWGKDLQINIPQSTKAVILTVNQIDGTKSVVLGSDNSNPWFEVVSDLNAKTVVIKPKKLNIALGG